VLILSIFFWGCICKFDLGFMPFVIYFMIFFFFFFFLKFGDQITVGSVALGGNFFIFYFFMHID
jgi:hypothetical protein